MTMTRRDLLFSLSGLALAATTACSGDDSGTPTSPSTGSAPFSTTDLRVGTGATAATGQRVATNYTGWLYSNSAAENKGARFDGGSYTFTLGAGQVIRGWDQGIPGMRVGGLRRIVIPPELAYGNTSPGGGIPANATLLFEVELVSIL